MFRLFLGSDGDRDSHTYYAYVWGKVLGRSTNCDVKEVNTIAKCVEDEVDRLVSGKSNSHRNKRDEYNIR